MAKKSKRELDYLDFAKVWNDTRAYPARYDLERALGAGSRAIQARFHRLTEFRKKNANPNLPELIWRESTTGGVSAVPQGVRRQLNEFRFDLKQLEKAKGVVVTSAQFGAPLNKWHWEALKHYAKDRGFPLVVLPIKYGRVTTVYNKQLQERVLTSTFPDELKGHMIFENVSLCNGRLMLNTMRMRPTLQRFLNEEVCIRGGDVSQIYAAPKLELEHLPRVGHKSPKGIRTTGAVTHPNYHVDNLGQQDRTGEIAIQEHCYAAIVVEFAGKAFHWRELHANKRGQFYDIDTKRGGAKFCTHRGIEHRPDDVDTLVCGDWHTGKTATYVRNGTFVGKNSMVSKLRVKNIVLHDFVDCDSVSHWEQNQASRRAFKAPLGWDSLEGELNQAVGELEWMRKHAPWTQLHVVASNHNEYVTEFIETQAYKKDNMNLAIGNRLATVMDDDLRSRMPLRKEEAKAIDPVVWWFRKYAPFAKSYERKADDALRPGGEKNLLLPKTAKKPFLCMMHGDKGPKGMPTRSTKAFLAMNTRLIVGHNHSAIILNSIRRVGTSTPLMQFYVEVPMTGWTNTHGALFKNGQCQLLNFIGSEDWHG